MKTALVLGITGTFGGAAARALRDEGYAIKTLLREPSRLPNDLNRVEVIQGDAMQVADIRRAAEGVEVMVYGINPPGYNWAGKAIPMLENAAQVVEEKRLTMLFPGNVYVLDPAQGPEFDESAQHRPVSKKGEMRRVMEQRLQRAAQHGAQVIILRAGDFISARSKSSWINVLIKPTRRGIRVGMPGNPDLLHTWAYIPDMARTAVALLKRRETLGAFNVFHFKGYRVSMRELAQTIETASGQRVQLRKFPWWAIYLMAPFSVMFRGLLEMRYLWRQEVNLVDDKLVGVLGKALPHTPLGQALVESGLLGEPARKNQAAFVLN